MASMVWGHAVGHGPLAELRARGTIGAPATGGRHPQAAPGPVPVQGGRGGAGPGRDRPLWRRLRFQPLVDLRSEPTDGECRKHEDDDEYGGFNGAVIAYHKFTG
jgi:hypothetical protein